MLEGLLLPVVLALLSGGGLVGFLGWLLAKKKAPAERDSIVVQSAETAALSLTKSLDAETKRADRLQSENDEKDAELRRLRAEVQRLRDQVSDLLVRLDAAITKNEIRHTTPD